MAIALLHFPGRVCQQARRCGGNFKAYPSGTPLSSRSNPLGYWDWSACCHPFRHVLHLPAVPSLHVHYRRFIATMAALTPAMRSRLFGILRMNTVHIPLRRSPCFTCTAFRSFRLHPPDSPLRRFLTLPLSAQSFRRVARGLDFAIASQARRSARPYRVRYPTDWSFTSRCFRPHLTMTPLRLISGRRAHTWRGLAPRCPCTLAGARCPLPRA
jgi:hypothetical protein